MCGACTIHVGGRATRSCITPISAVEGAEVTTIEGLDPAGQHPVQQAWLDLQTPQCGYCQSGQIMTAAALLRHKPRPTRDDVDQAMAGNICRCGTYPRIRLAIEAAVDRAAGALDHAAVAGSEPRSPDAGSPREPGAPSEPGGRHE
jgi:isoquinoline 1-oxidoreductase alpha subunit